MKKLLFLTTLLLSLFLVNCKDEKEDLRVTSIKLEEIKEDIFTGNEYQLKVLHSPANLEAPEYNWISSNTNIATIDDSGKLKALKEGKTTIKVSAPSLQLETSLEISVMQTLASSITIKDLEQDIFIGDEYKLTVTYNPEDAPEPEYTWESSDTEVATVDNTGKIKALKDGKTTIKVSAPSLKLTNTIEITVLPIKPTSIKLDKDYHEMKTGESFTFSVVIEPENTTYKHLLWESSNEDIATVSEDGVVNAISDGEVIVKVSLGDLEDECRVKINPVNVSGISLHETSKVLEREEIFKIIATVTPANAKDKSVVWASSDETVATVDQEGNVKAKALGGAIISATTNDGNFTSECSITVTPISVKRVEWSSTYITLLEGTSSSENALTYRIYPQNADNQSVTTSSSNPEIASWTHGKISTLQTGQTTLTIKTDDGGHEASCIIEVVDITHYVNLTFGSSAISNIMGYMTGSVNVILANSSEKTIENVQIGVKSINETSPSYFSPIGDIYGYGDARFKINFDRVYRPIIVCEFIYNGKTYQIEREFTTN